VYPYRIFTKSTQKSLVDRLITRPRSTRNKRAPNLLPHHMNSA
jgi:hypothetical protein